MAKEKKDREPSGGSTFKVTAEVLERLYRDTLQVLSLGVKAGSANNIMGVISIDKLADMLHGGAYAVPINELPFFLPDPTKSPYYAGELRNLPSEGLASYLAQFFAGTNAEQNAIEILMDANAPHVFPKILSDQAYARHVILYSQAATSTLFTTVGTGLKTYVESATKALEAVEGKGGGEDTDEIAQNVKAALASAATTAEAIG